MKLDDEGDNDDREEEFSDDDGDVNDRNIFDDLF